MVQLFDVKIILSIFYRINEIFNNINYKLT